jgi:hypothetical protein
MNKLFDSSRAKPPGRANWVRLAAQTVVVPQPAGEVTPDGSPAYTHFIDVDVEPDGTK